MQTCPSSRPYRDKVRQADRFWRVQNTRVGCRGRSYGVHAIATAKNSRQFFAVVSFISRRRLLAWPAMRTRRCKRTSATPRISSFLPPMQDRCVHGPSVDPSARIHALQIFIRVVHLPSTEIAKFTTTAVYSHYPQFRICFRRS